MYCIDYLQVEKCLYFFRAMFTDNMRERRQEEVVLNGISPLGVKLLIEYAYTSKIALDLGMSTFNVFIMLK